MNWKKKRSVVDGQMDAGLEEEEEGELITATRRNDERDSEKKKTDDDENENDDCEEDNDNEGIPVDKGYSWVICLCTCYMNMNVFGHNRCLSALLVDIREEFQESQTVISLTFTAFSLSLALSSVLASNVILRFFQPRTACFASAILSSVSLILASVAPNIGLWLVAYTCRGLAAGCLMIIPMSLIGYYFKKRRALAASISMMGSVVSNIAYPPLATFLREEFGLRGALLLISTIDLQMIALSLLLRSPSSYTKIHRMKQARQAKGRLKVIGEKQQSLIETRSCGDYEAADDFSKQNGGCDEVNDTLIKAKNPNHDNHDNKEENVMRCGSSVPNNITGLLCASVPNSTISCLEQQDAYSYQGEEGENNSKVDVENSADIELGSLRQLTQDEKKTMMNSFGSEKSLNGFVHHHLHHHPHGLNVSAALRTPLPAYHSSQMSMISTMGSTVDVPFMISDKDKNEDRMEKENGGGGGNKEQEETTCSQVCRLRTFFDLELLKSWVFHMIAVFISVSTVANLIAVYLPLFASMSGLSRQQASLLLTIGGVADLMTRLFIGWFADKNLITKEKMIAFSLFMVAILSQFGRYITTLPLFIMFSLLSSVFCGFRANLFHALLFDYFGPEVAPRANSLCLVYLTVFLSLNHPITGALLDRTGDFSIPLHYIGALMGLSACLLLFKPLFARWDGQNKEESNTNETPTSDA